MFLAMLFVLLSSCAFGMDKQPEKINYTLASSLDPDRTEAIKIKYALKIVSETPTNEYNTLVNRIPENTLRKTSWHLFDLPENWNKLNDDVQNIIMSLKTTIDPFRNQKYNCCTCTSAIHKPMAALKQITTYYTGSFPISTNKRTSIRVELVPLYIKWKENKIYSVQEDNDGSVHIGTHIATLQHTETNNTIWTITLQSFVDLTNPKNNIIGVKIMGDDEDAGQRFTESFHYIATPKKSAPFPPYLALAEKVMQSTNYEDLLCELIRVNEPTDSEIRIKPYTEVQKLIAKKSKNKQTCVTQ